jgi:hypothetical protein
MISRLERALTRVRRAAHGDGGLGVVTVLMVGAVVSALTITAVALTINNLGNASRDRQALAAMATSEAGVAQAVQFLRGGNLSNLTCIEPPAGAAPGPTCQGATESWISAVAPRKIRTDGVTGPCVTTADCVRVWIGTLKPYVPNCSGRHQTPPVPCSGTYRVHTTGVSGNGPGQKALAVDVEVTPYPFPIGVFAENFSGNGNVGVHKMSMFTNGCMYNRQRDDVSGSGLQFEYDAAAGRPVLDLVYDQPVAAHAVGDISTSNQSCGTGGGGAPIHSPTTVCNALFRFDQSGAGGALTSGDDCHGKYVRGDGSVYPTTSRFDGAELQRYGYRPRGLTDAQYDALRSQAQAQGTYNIAPTSVSTRLTSLSGAGVTSPVLFWDNGDVALTSSDFPASFLRSLSSTAGCTSKSVTIVVEGAGNDLKYTGGTSEPYLVASIFVPDGQLTGQGGRNTIGTVFAKTIDLGGSVDFYMDQCFASNPPGAVLDAQIINFREDDGKDVQ